MFAQVGSNDLGRSFFKDMTNKTAGDLRVVLLAINISNDRMMREELYIHVQIMLRSYLEECSK